MRVVIQRVLRASVAVGPEETGAIGPGLLVLAGWEEADTREDLQWMAQKITVLRIFNNAEGVMDLSVKDTDGDILIVSQFTLHASTKKGNRPSYMAAARPQQAFVLYEKFISLLSIALSKPVHAGRFGEHMNVELINDGPVTIIIDSKNRN
ncbi:MAG: D-aminoacyl-tRNA deacylase [Bacteroidota bacterium]|nr:D-aminoacyl-tRNA deacylase [Bacteroidota bacterium]